MFRATEKKLQIAVSLHRAGHLEKAERIYRELLQKEARHPDAHHNLGVIKMQQGQATHALPYLQKAIELQPENGLYWLDYIEAIHLAGEHERARQTFIDAQKRGLSGPEAQALASRIGLAAHPPPPPADEIRQLHQAFSEGKLDLAIHQAHRLIERHPQHAFSWQVLAAALQHQEKNNEALPAARQAVALSPEDPNAHYNLGIILGHLRQAAEATQCFQEVLRQQSDHASAWYNLGVQQLATRQIEEAESSFRQSCRLNPKHAETYNNLGLTLRKQNRPDEAGEAFQKAIELDPRYLAPHFNLGILLHETGQLREAEKSYRNTLHLQPRHTDAHNHLGLVLMDMERYEEAETAFRTAIHLQPDDTGAYYHLATLQQTQREDTAAEETLRQAVQRAPDDATAKANLGHLLIEQGRFDEAETLLNQALAQAPENIKALSTALRYLPYRKEDERFGQLEKQYATRHLLETEERISLCFAMGKAMMDIHETERAFEAYNEGNRLHFAQRPYRESQDTEMLDKIRHTYTARLFADYATLDQALPPTPDNRIPVFIVGMPRSGSTLIEQVLASHPDIFGAGELPISHQFTDPLKLLELLLPESPDPQHRLAALRRIGQNYLDEQWKLAPDARCIVDKQLGNFCHLGLIHLMLPQARIIHAQRDPIDTCLSCYTTQFNQGLFFTYDQATLARHHLFYQNVMAHWQATLPADRILTIPYEDHVLHPEQTARRILEHLGLPWHEACLHPHRAQRTVRTASLVQVRHPIHPHAVARWKKFARHLTPLLALLRPEVTDELPDELSLLTTTFRENRHDEAIQHAHRLIQKNAHLPVAWQILGASLLALNQPEKALAALKNAVDLQPHEAGPHYNLSVAFDALQRHDEAIAALQKAIALQPTHLLAHYNLATLLQNSQRHPEAERHFREALRLQPEHADTHNNLGILLKQQGRFNEATHCFEQALLAHPQDLSLHNNLGIALQLCGRYAESENILKKALDLNPEHPSTRIHLGLVQMDTGKRIEAEANFRRALELTPDAREATETLNHLGKLLDKSMRLDEARACYQRALALKPDDVTTCLNLASLSNRCGKLEEAEQYCRRALEIEPENAAAHSALLLCLSHRNTLAPEALHAEHLKFGERVETPLKNTWQAHTNPRAPEKCLRIGLVSGDLFNHVAAAYIQPMLVHLSLHKDIELFVYDNQTTNELSSSLRSHLPHWCVIAGLSDECLARHIRTDGIDILIDLSGHTPNNRLTCFAHRPAPIQISWIGYPGTTGLSSMDYFLADRFFLPPGECDHLFTEKIVYLPTTLPFLIDEDAPPVQPLPALTRGHLTFGSFNRPNKIHPDVVALWSRLLHALPDSRMVLGAMTDETTRDQIHEWFCQQNINPERLTFLQRCEKQAYLAQHHSIDLCLDTFPYNGSATAGNALWMGVPTLTLSGKGIASRSGAAWQRHFGLEAFVATDPGNFIHIGTDWARRREELSTIRNHLRDRIRCHDACHPEKLTMALAQTLRTLWRSWCSETPALPGTNPP